MTAIPELAEACELQATVADRKQSTADDERAYRALLLRAVAKGATRAEIQQSCSFTRSRLEAEIRKARAETTDPKLRKVGLPARGLTLGEYFCPTAGCDRAEGNGNEPFTSAQARALHRVQAHDFHLGGRPLTKALVKRARRDETTPTSDLARRWDVSVHALRAARSGRTWASLDGEVPPLRTLT